MDYGDYDDIDSHIDEYADQEPIDYSFIFQHMGLASIVQCSFILFLIINFIWCCFTKKEEQNCRKNRLPQRTENFGNEPGEFPSTSARKFEVAAQTYQSVQAEKHQYQENTSRHNLFKGPASFHVVQQQHETQSSLSDVLQRQHNLIKGPVSLHAVQQQHKTQSSLNDVIQQEHNLMKGPVSLHVVQQQHNLITDPESLHAVQQEHKTECSLNDVVQQEHNLNEDAVSFHVVEQEHETQSSLNEPNTNRPKAANMDTEDQQQPTRRRRSNSADPLLYRAKVRKEEDIAFGEKVEEKVQLDENDGGNQG